MTDKTCTRCGETKPISEFGKHSNCKGGYSTNCKVCCVERTKEWQRNNPEKLKRRAELRAKRKLRAILIMGGQCQNPGCGFRPKTQLGCGVLQFHHRKGNHDKEKIDDVVRNILSGETEEYMLLCATCHVIYNHIDGTRRISLSRLSKKEFFRHSGKGNINIVSKP